MHSLSARLLVLTAFFVMLAEVLIFVPSVARFRADWLGARIEAASLAMRALDAAPDRAVGDMLKSDLLMQVGAHAVLVNRGGARLVLSGVAPPPVDASFDLAGQGPWALIGDAIVTLFTPGNRVIRVLAPAPGDATTGIELVLDEAPLRADMVAFGGRILTLSIVISLVTATLVYLSLHWLLVRPMRRLTGSMTAFSENPEDVRRIVVPSGRRDEIGLAERQLAAMQRGLRAALAQREHLAALGTAVAKVNHDLRGVLSSALLVSDRLESSDDPEVRRLAPTLVSAIERAAALCGRTLDYVGRGQPEIRMARFPLGPLVHEVQAGFPAGAIDNQVIDGFSVVADRDQIYRVLHNLAGNAIEAGAAKVSVIASMQPDGAAIDIADDGPGLPPRAREKLFLPFEGSARAGGTGLGLAIAREIARAHGGDLVLLRSDAAGTVFRLRLPAGPVSRAAAPAP